VATLSPMRRLILLVGGLLSLAVIAWTALSLVDLMGRVSYADDRVLPAAGQHLVVRGSGDLEISASTDGRVHVHTAVRYGLYRPRLVQESTPDGVLLDGGCRGWIGFNSCTVDYAVQVPREFTVEVHSTAGDVSVAGLSGSVSVSTTAGDVSADQDTGPITLSTHAGDVRATHLGSRTVTATTHAGDVQLTFTAPPGTVTARTSAGDIDVAVPAGTEGGYLVTATSNAGDEHVDSRLQSATSWRRITASSSAGDVSVHPTTG
jgi:hypothetical protein